MKNKELIISSKLLRHSIFLGLFILLNLVSYAQSRTVTGKIINSKGEALPFVNIVIKGQTQGVSSTENGSYNISVTDANSVLQFSFIGYATKEVSVGTQNVINITMEDEFSSLDEVIVVGYGTQRKVNLTGAVSAISSEEVKDRVQSNLLASVQGTVPGVTIISRNGQAPSINFRGRGNLGTSSPLYVIDGVISNATVFSNLDPNSIESISFLKDAASSSIYGSRAAYGVVLVTTKRGDKGQIQVSYSGLAAFKSPTYLPDLIDSWEYADLLNEAFFNRNPNGGLKQAYSDEEIQWFKDGSKPDLYPNTKWADLVLDTPAFFTQHSVNFSGGNKSLSYYANLGYLKDNDLIPGKPSERYNFNINLSSEVTDWLTLRTGIKYIQNLSKTEHGIPWTGNFVLVPSIMVAKQSNGEWGSMAGGRTATQTFIQNNPLRTLSNSDWSNNKTENNIYDFGVDLKPFKSFVVTGQASYTGYESKAKSYTALQPNVNDFVSGNPIMGTGVEINRMTMNWSSNTRMMYTATAKYDFSFDKHEFNVLAGTSYEHYKSEYLAAKRKDFPTDGLIDIISGANNEDFVDDSYRNNNYMREMKLQSYFGRINYSYNSKYLLEANLRADASSQFHKDHRWGYFPSFSAGWRISEEEFFKEVSFINNMKVRASWGNLGNINNVGYYDYFQNYGINTDYSFNKTAVKGISESKPANPTLGWERVSITDFGVDIDLFSSKLSVTADYYIKNTKDILLGYNVMYETGIDSSPSQNIGKVENKGFEFAVTHRNSLGDFSYSVSANFALNDNKVTDMGTSDNYIQSGGDKITYILKTGEKIGSYYGYATNGLYTQQEIDEGHYYSNGRKPNAGDIKYVPQRQDVEWGAEMTGEDRKIIGKDVPSLTYGLNISLQYKNIEFSVFGQGVSGTSVAFESEQAWAFFLNSNPRKFHLQRWTVDNPNVNAPYPRIYGGHSMDNYNQSFSDYQVFDADYFRIRSISLGYKLPDNITSKLKLSSLKFFLTGENLFTFRADKIVKDFDPEAPSGRGLGAYGVKSIALGINIGF